MADYQVSIASNKTGVIEVPCKSINHAKKLMRLFPRRNKSDKGYRFIKIVQEAR